MFHGNWYPLLSIYLLIISDSKQFWHNVSQFAYLTPTEHVLTLKN